MTLAISTICKRRIIKMPRVILRPGDASCDIAQPSSAPTLGCRAPPGSVMHAGASASLSPGAARLRASRPASASASRVARARAFVPRAFFGGGRKSAAAKVPAVPFPNGTPGPDGIVPGVGKGMPKWPEVWEWLNYEKRMQTVDSAEAVAMIARARCSSTCGSTRTTRSGP